MNYCISHPWIKVYHHIQNCFFDLDPRLSKRTDGGKTNRYPFFCASNDIAVIVDTLQPQMQGKVTRTHLDLCATCVNTYIVNFVCWKTDSTALFSKKTAS